MKISEDVGLRFSACLTKDILLHPVLIIGLALMCIILQADGSIFHVTNSLDNGKGLTLRMAITKANSAGGSNTIILTNEIYNLTLVGADENSAHAGDLDITKGKLTILGVFKTNVIISATMLGDRVFQVLPGAQLTLSNLVITGGCAEWNQWFIRRHRREWRRHLQRRHVDIICVCCCWQYQWIRRKCLKFSRNRWQWW